MIIIWPVKYLWLGPSLLAFDCQPTCSQLIASLKCQDCKPLMNLSHYSCHKTVNKVNSKLDVNIALDRIDHVKYLTIAYVWKVILHIHYSNL